MVSDVGAGVAVIDGDGVDDGDGVGSGEIPRTASCAGL